MLRKESSQDTGKQGEHACTGDGSQQGRSPQTPAGHGSLGHKKQTTVRSNQEPRLRSQ